MTSSMICPACGASTTTTNIKRHRRRPEHIAAVEAAGQDLSRRPYGPPPFTDEQFRERFWARVDQSGGPDACWPWTGNRQAKGYGKVARRGKFLVTSRVALEFAKGSPLAVGAQACHTCDNPPCCNPAHLFEGVPLANTRDMLSKGRLPRGARRPGAKLDEASVRAIRSESNDLSRGDLAVRFGVSEATIRDVVQGRKWRHVA